MGPPFVAARYALVTAVTHASSETCSSESRTRPGARGDQLPQGARLLHDACTRDPWLRLESSNRAVRRERALVKRGHAHHSRSLNETHIRLRLIATPEPDGGQDCPFAHRTAA